MGKMEVKRNMHLLTVNYVIKGYSLLPDTYKRGKNYLPFTHGKLQVREIVSPKITKLILTINTDRY